MRKLLVTAAIGGLAAGAFGEVVSLDARHNPAAANFFTLDFGDGTPRDAQITDTVYDLRIDEVDGTARFVRYLQFIDPIEIPAGPGITLSTGDITVEVVLDSSIGSYDDGSGAFATSEDYKISFTGDLSLIGFTSPVVLPSTSGGTVSFDNTGTVGTIDQIWSGDTQVGMFPLHYECRVNTTFEVRFPGDLNCDSSVAATDITPFVLALTNPAAFASQFPTCDIDLADINGDGRVSVSDIGEFVGLLVN